MAAELVGNELPRRLALLFQNLVEEALSGSPVSVACDQNIQDVAVLVHRSPKIIAFAANGDEHFVHVPDVAESTLSSPRSTSIGWSKLPAPGTMPLYSLPNCTHPSCRKPRHRLLRETTSRRLRAEIDYQSPVSAAQARCTRGMHAINSKQDILENSANWMIGWLHSVNDVQFRALLRSNRCGTI